ncbi:PQ loop repeat protein [Penicillium pulvis]|uniref:PQ loop repeat protein n=1 Tax=Penicillium pulvis TaxID=1562058 RepID=UPI002546FF3A|nr:PQ loop repeat protein [Penicillium pulvis]KAJ5805649.1 PQ loop repeat protein [Penicillium pulvis]
MSNEDKVTVASNVLGTIGTVCWCIQLVPQIWHNWRRKKTEGLPLALGFLWAVQPQIFGFFSTIVWAQILHYGHGYGRVSSTLCCCGLLVLLGGIEAMLILTLRIPYSKGVTWPDLLVGIVATILLGGSWLPVYPELWKRKGRVVGFNWVFLSIDTLGGLFSLFALAAQGSFDILGGVMYIFVVLVELGIYVSHIIWRIRFRELRKQARLLGKSIDELLEANHTETCLV